MITYNKYNRDNDIIPSYLEADFMTALIKERELLVLSDTFKDYNFHGANITMILELLAYLTDFSSFHTNMVSRNVYLDSANIYETVHALAQQKGYNARGYISSWVTATLTLTGSFSEGDTIYIEPWQQINTGLTTDLTEPIYYSITDEVTHVVPETGTYTVIEFPLRQGKVETLTYTGEDLIDNKIILPFHNYDYGSFPFNRTAIDVYINNERWQRVDDFYDLLSGLLDSRSYEESDYTTNLLNEKNLENDDVFMFKYDKYRRYVVEFNSSRNVPKDSDDIVIHVIETLGADGIIRKNVFNNSTTGLNNLLIYHNEDLLNNTESIFSFVNDDASVGGTNPETIEEVKIGSKSVAHSQYRNITGKDYRYHLEAHTDIIRGLAWGEQEVDPGNVLEYNKTYISVIPPEGTPVLDDDDEFEIDSETGLRYPYLFLSGTINTEVFNWTWDDGYGHIIEEPIEKAISFTDDFKNDVLQYLEPRKMLNNYEVLVLPDIVYFRFDIGIRARRIFNYQNVMNDVRNKLVYFFDRNNRFFREEISFMDIHNFILDTSITTNDDDFKYIPGVDNLVLREINVYTTYNEGDEEVIFEPPAPSAGAGRFPQYKYESYESYYDNQLRPILLNYNQFPMVAIDMCRFFRET